MRGKAQYVFYSIGILLILSAVLFMRYNVDIQETAGASSEVILGELSGRITPAEAYVPQSMPTMETGAVEMQPLPLIKQPQQQPDYVLNPDMPMPQTEIDGVTYIGILNIPALGIELPIAGSWSYPLLRKTPCRYYGSAYKDNLVIAAHNYDTHFGNLKTLAANDKVTFTDIDGNVFSYHVSCVEILEPTAVDQMTSGDYALTLFTCTLGGEFRVTVRCDRD